MHKVFISYHHESDQSYKEYLVQMSQSHRLFLDRSVNTGDIGDSLSDERIREIIRDDYLRDSTVTIVLVGLETRRRKHVDWEIYSIMFDGKVNKKSGILIVNLPETSDWCIAARELEKKKVYPDIQSWEPIYSRDQLEKIYPYMPARIIDNLLKPEVVNISVVPWSRIHKQPERIRYLIEATFQDRKWCEYDLSRPMRRRNSSNALSQLFNEAANRRIRYWNTRNRLAHLLESLSRI